MPDQYIQISFTKEVEVHVKDWLENTTSHGIRRILHSKYTLLKLVWIFLFFASTSYAIYLCVDTLRQYTRNETVVSQRIIRESTATFPAVTFCNLNLFNDDILRIIIRNAYNGSVDSFFNTTEQLQNEIKRLMANEKLKLKKGNDTEYNFDAVSLGLMTPISCKFNGKKCEHEWFYPNWINKYGFCYTFNYNKTTAMGTRLVGQDYGLSIALQTRSEIDAKLSDRNGVYLIVHSQVDAIDGVLNKGINLPPGFDTYVSVKRTVYTKIPFNSVRCIKSLDDLRQTNAKLSDLFQNLYGSYEYDQPLCMSLCFQTNLFLKCACVDILTESIIDAHFCQNETELECLDGFKSQFMSDGFNCKHYCIEKCAQQTYTLLNSMSSFSPDKYIDKIQLLDDGNDSDISTRRQFIKDSVVAFTVNFNDLSCLEIVETQKQTVNNLIGSIGGQFSLCIGISLLSITELIELFTELALLFYKRLPFVRTKTYVVTPR